MILRIVLFSLVFMIPLRASADSREHYKNYCADCHGQNRLGLMGPALIPEPLKRMRGPKIEKVIASESKFRQVYINRSDLRLSSLTDPRNVIPFRYYGYCTIIFCVFIFTLWVLV